MSRRHIEVAVRYIWRERGATNLDGGHVVRPILIGLALGRPADDLLDGPRFSGNSGDHIPYPKVFDCSLVFVGENLRPTKETLTTVSRTAVSRTAWDATHSMSERCGSNRRGYRGKDTRHCNHVSACPPIVGRLPAFWRTFMHMVLQALEVSNVCRLTAGRCRTNILKGYPH